MTAQPKLLEVPPDRPTKARQLKAFKSCFDIRTHNAGGRGEQRWLALIPFKGHRNLTLCEIVCDYGGLYDDSGNAAYGTGELSAIRKLCKQMTIQCDL